MNKGGVFIVSGPSGVGKDTVLCFLFKRDPNLLFSISSITRPMREGEKEGEKYHFIPAEEFKRMIEEDMLLEYNVYADNYYGTPAGPVKEAIAAGRDMIIEVDVNGAAQIRKRLPEAVSIFIMPPSVAELEHRLVARGTETPEKIRKRMETALEEIARAGEYDYIVTNEDVEEAAAQMFAIIQSQRFTAERQPNLINEVLSKC